MVGGAAKARAASRVGPRFDVLVKRRPELRQELLTFRDALMAGEDDDAIKASVSTAAAAAALALQPPCWSARPRATPRHALWHAQHARPLTTARSLGRPAPLSC
jgi:hypothetical protein